ncbi:Kinesin-like protein KIN-13A [Camellia lanceoleosa]|uniref:Kinesin-like protein KIN-13A n=1 Tax=Camellia lanceoleosa TaxID=1840588 RepID=A0ACC0GKX5_9ERIC|nr:Kinesin-like protein KIN-13A [Camellia lanceoleosa]
MGGQMQQSNDAVAALYNHSAGGGSLHNAGPGSDAGDAGLQHLASPLASTGINQRLLPNLLMQYLWDSLWPVNVNMRISHGFLWPFVGEHDCCFGLPLEQVSIEEVRALGASGLSLEAEIGLSGIDGLDFTVGEAPHNGIGFLNWAPDFVTEEEPL